ncbi:uncharacterized protein [Branchiostoma lanceolatum]|uniref:uncharacterized protein isoform X2 n=1 Tax=Branchiostoma lanceolatum TaxID=7740 RepID=UPI003452B8FC
MGNVGHAIFFAVISLALLGRTTADPTWKLIDGLLKFVSVGSKGVWGVNRNDDIYYRSGTLEDGEASGSGWVNIAGKLKQISSGHSVWGVNANDDIFIRQGLTASNPTGTSWLNVAGKLKQLDVSSTANQIWGVNSNDNIYRRTGITTDLPAGTNWEQVDGLLKFVSVGPAGIWGVNANDDIFYRTGTFGNEASAGSGWEHIEGKLKQISSGDNIVWGVNVNDDIFIREGISLSTPAGTGWKRIPGKLKQVETGPIGRQAWGVNSGDYIYQRINLTATGPLEPIWKSTDGLLKFVSVGSKGVWGINRNDDIYYRSGTLENGESSGSGWVNIAGKLKQISSGHSVWGVNAIDNIFIRQGLTASNPTGTSWLNVAGKLKQLDVSSTANQVWGVNTNDNIYRRTGITTDLPAGTDWEQVDGLLKFVSVGPAGVWGVNANDDIFYRTGTFGNEASAGSGWEHIEGKLKQISSGDNIVWGVNVNDDIFIREGISLRTPAGTGWKQIPGKLKQVETGLSGQQAWGVNSGDYIFKRTRLTATRPSDIFQLPTIDDYTVRAGDCSGNDIWSIYGDGITLQDCAERCTSHPDCVSFMFFDNKRCFPKSRTCEETSKDNPKNVFYDKIIEDVLSGVDGYTPRHGDCPGNDIWSIYGDEITLQDCAERCTSHADCVAFMFFDNKRCFPKTETCDDTRKENPKNVFYDKNVAPLPTIDGFSARRGDCPGNDIWSIYRDEITLSDCAERCTSHADCVAFMFFDNKRCFPKTKTCQDTNKDNPKNVFYDKPFVVTERNVALNKMASQSSLFRSEYPAERAVDGNTGNVLYPRQECTHTDLEYEPWWKVDLGDTYVISHVTIINRGDCCGERLQNFMVRVGPFEDLRENTPCGDIYSETPSDGETIDVRCAEPISGRWVSVQLIGREDYLSLCEVQVFSGSEPKSVRLTDETSKRWRDDLRCGSEFPAPNATRGECDPDSCFPCCSQSGYCGNTPEHCDCADCVNYGKIYGVEQSPAWSGLSEEALLSVSWREDFRCGPGFSAPGAEVAECNPHSCNPCCSGSGWCGNTDDHCGCPDCVDYRSHGVPGIKWREDGRCGPEFSAPGTDPGECDPISLFPCCSAAGECSGTAAHCKCEGCIDFRKSPGTDVSREVRGFLLRVGDCPGNDIWSLYGDDITLDACAERCNSHADCVAFMFFDNRRCFPKTKTCKKMNKDNRKNVFYDKESATLLSVEGYTVRTGDCPGNDIWSIYGDDITLSDCAERCTSHADCVAFMFFDNKRCFPKTNTCEDTSKDNPKNVFYDKKIERPPIVDGFSVRRGDCPGNDIWSIYGDGITQSDCAERCTSHADCVAFMFFDNKRCFPKTKTCEDTSKENPKNVFYDKDIVSMTASSERGPAFTAQNSKLDWQETATAAGAWSAQPWLMFDLGRSKRVTSVVTQGRNYSPDWPGESHEEWVTSYSISYGDEKGDEAWYAGNDGETVAFEGNTDRDSKVRHDFSDFSGPFTARFVKIHPRTWHGWVSMRAELDTDPYLDF